MRHACQPVRPCVSTLHTAYGQTIPSVTMQCTRATFPKAPIRAQMLFDTCRSPPGSPGAPVPYRDAAAAAPWSAHDRFRLRVRAIALRRPTLSSRSEIAALEFTRQIPIELSRSLRPAFGASKLSLCAPAYELFRICVLQRTGSMGLCSKGMSLK